MGVNSIQLNFKKWLLSEMPHLAIKSSTPITLPDEHGYPYQFNASYVDPRFELDHPNGEYRDPITQDLVQVPWQQMLMQNGTGWEGKLPFQRNQFFVYTPNAVHGKIGASEGLPRLPDDWYTNAEFADQDGQVVYDAKKNIFNSVNSQAKV